MKYHAVSSEHGLWAVQDTLRAALAALEECVGLPLETRGEWKRWGGAEWIAVPVPGSSCGSRYLIWREEAP